MASINLQSFIIESLTEYRWEADPMVAAWATVDAWWFLVPWAMAMATSFAAFLAHAAIPREVVVTRRRRNNGQHQHRKHENQNQLFIHRYSV